MAMLELKNVSKLYGFGDATTLALDEVSLKIEQNDFVAVMGPSGCGKSTLMNVIGLLDQPTHGIYKFASRNSAKFNSDYSAKLRRDSIGFIFQYFNMLPRMTILENVALPLTYKGLSTAKRLKQASAMLERVGLQDREYFYPGQLSGGQVQCAAIARALVNNPKLIIADEPTGNLDSAGSRLIMELLREIHKMGNTILFVTHNPELTRYASRMVYMRDGAILQDETSKFGEVAPTALSSMYSVTSPTEDEVLAGVSALMKAVPQKSTPQKDGINKSRKKPKKPTKSTRKTKQRGKSR